jgi:hypothetical protein
LQLVSIHLARLVVVKIVEELVEGVLVLVALLWCRRRWGWWCLAVEVHRFHRALALLTW